MSTLQNPPIDSSPQGPMFMIRNALICLGVFWLSLWMARSLAWPLGKLNDNVIYDTNVVGAIAMGVMSSLSRTLAAALAGVVVALVVASRRPQLWALFVAVLSVVDAPVRHHWGSPAASWDLQWQCVDLLFPAVICMATAAITAHFRAKHSTSTLQ
jgi:hypothetical protein